jgi:hypothetical protein
MMIWKINWNLFWLVFYEVEKWGPIRHNFTYNFQ